MDHGHTGSAWTYIVRSGTKGDKNARQEADDSHRAEERRRVSRMGCVHGGLQLGLTAGYPGLVGLPAAKCSWLRCMLGSCGNGTRVVSDVVGESV